MELLFEIIDDINSIIKYEEPDVYESSAFKEFLHLLDDVTEGLCDLFRCPHNRDWIARDVQLRIYKMKAMLSMLNRPSFFDSIDDCIIKLFNNHHTIVNSPYNVHLGDTL